jgi:hypothetical protein
MVGRQAESSKVGDCQPVSARSWLTQPAAVSNWPSSRSAMARGLGGQYVAAGRERGDAQGGGVGPAIGVADRDAVDGEGGGGVGAGEGDQVAGLGRLRQGEHAAEKARAGEGLADRAGVVVPEPGGAERAGSGRRVEADPVRLPVGRGEQAHGPAGGGRPGAWAAGLAVQLDRPENLLTAGERRATVGHLQ